MTWFVLAVVALAAVGAVVLRTSGLGTNRETITIVHWSNGHLLRDGSGLRLMRQMAEEFNRGDHTIADGRRIEVAIHYNGSGDQAADLLARVTHGLPVDRDLPDPTIVTPSAAHWLVTVNHEAGREVVDLSSTSSQSIARAYIGIVTYREMAECLGWPERAIGFADIIALRSDPRGWSAYDCARAEWGATPLFAFTDPTTSDTGRGVLLSLYAIAAGKAPEDLEADDVTDPDVVAFVRSFSRMVDHYMIGTIPLNTKVYQGPRYGHFFVMPEDNLIHLYEGTEKAFIDGIEVEAPPIGEPMVMIYPREGSIIRDNCACLVRAPWVLPEHEEAARQWVAFLREDAQQRSFMAAGFRPGTEMALADPISGRYGLDPAQPRGVMSPERIDPAVAEDIIDRWDEVKRPGIVVFAVDVSGSMHGEKLALAKEGLTRALDTMAGNNRVGMVAFSDSMVSVVEVGELATNRFAITGAAERLGAAGNTALYDAIALAVGMADGASGDADAIRGVVVLTDGRANDGTSRLDEIVTMSSRDEVDIASFGGFSLEDVARDIRGGSVPREQVIGVGMKLETQHPVQVFFIGVGDDADIQVGRILAEATGAEFQGVADDDLARVLAEFSKYF